MPDILTPAPTPATPPVAPESRQVAFDPETLTRMVVESVDRIVEARAQAQPTPAPTAIVPENQRTPNGRVVAQRDTDGPDGVNVQTHRLIKAIASRDHSGMHAVQQHMQRAGLYEGAAWGQLNGEQRAISLTSSEGAPFLPVTVDNKIEEIREELGVARRICSVYNFNSGTHKVPNTSGRPDVFAVNEGAEIKMRKATWGSVTLDPKKWGVIRAYTTEMGDEVGAQWVAKVIDQVARAFAEAEDASVFTADGTAAYHSLTGLLTAAGVGEYTQPATKVSFNDMTYAYAIETVKKAVAGARSNGVFVFHPDFQWIWALFTDPAGNYIYPPNAEITRLVRPAFFTEAMPGIAASAISTTFGLFGDFTYVNIGVQRGIEVKLLDQATIKDTDDSTAINLGAVDALALRFTARWDVKTALTSAFARIKTPAA